LIADCSIADDIINGLDRSSVVLVCLSQKYHESPYCRKGVSCVSNFCNLLCLNSYSDTDFFISCVFFYIAYLNSCVVFCGSFIVFLLALLVFSFFISRIVFIFDFCLWFCQLLPASHRGSWCARCNFCFWVFLFLPYIVWVGIKFTVIFWFSFSFCLFTDVAAQQPIGVKRGSAVSHNFPSHILGVIPQGSPKARHKRGRSSEFGPLRKPFTV